MRYLEFQVTVGGEGRTLGILGETHIYTQFESDYTKGIVERFSTIAMEGSDQDTMLNRGLSEVGGNAMRAVVRSEGRSTEFKSAYDWAQVMEKTVVPMRDTDSISSKQKVSLGCLLVVGRLLEPFVRRRKPKYTPEQERIAKEMAEHLVNVKERDRIMALAAATLIKIHSDVLLVCGEEHVDGIIKHLEGLVALEKLSEKKLNAS